MDILVTLSAVGMFDNFELDFVNQDQAKRMAGGSTSFDWDEDNLKVVQDSTSPLSGHYPGYYMSIDKAIDDLQFLREQGANAVFFVEHHDHQAFEIHGIHVAATSGESTDQLISLMERAELQKTLSKMKEEQKSLQEKIDHFENLLS